MKETLDLGVSFDDSNFNVDNIDVDDVILSVFCFDRSGSISTYVNEMNSAMKETIDKWKNSHHAEKIMYSQIEFDSNVEVIHGFQPIENVDFVDVKPRGLTALVDAVKLSIENAKSYYDSVLASGAEAKVMVFVFTDGEDNSSNSSPSDIKQMIQDINSDEENFGNFDFILYGMGNPNYFETLGNEMDFKVLKDDPNDSRTPAQKIRSAVTVVSQSVSSGNTNNLNTLVI